MPLSLDEVASVSGETPAAATTLLNELTRMRLVFRSTASTCVVLPGVRDAIVDRLGDGNLVGEDLTVESMQAWIDLTLRGTDGP